MSSERVLVIAGEASGDQHAADLVRNLMELRPGLGVYAVGGERLKGAGAEILFGSSELSVVGLFEVLRHIRPIFSAWKRVVTWLEHNRPSLLILVDFPEFNLLVAKKAKALGIPVFYYISPQVWAWRQGRVKKIRRVVDKMAVILPFEREFYKKYGMDVEFVGHPLLDSVGTTLGKEEFFEKLGIPSGNRLICLLPGSRTGEIRRHMKLFLSAARLIASGSKAVSFCLPLAPGLEPGAAGIIKEQATALASSCGIRVNLVENSAHDAIASSDLAIAASGTVTLEAAILKTPTIVTYRISPLTYFLGRRLIKVKYVSLVNLIADRQVVPEFLQKDATAENLSGAALHLLADRRAMAGMIHGLEETVARLGSPGAARRAASLAASMLG